MNPWDEVSAFFNQRKDNIDAGAADNIFIAWPSLLKGITRTIPDLKNVSLLDFGCGTGFCATKFHEMGAKVVACDTSEGMLALARHHSPKGIRFYPISYEQVSTLAETPFSLISSMMVFSFISDLRQALHDLDRALIPGGLLAFATFNPFFLENNKNIAPFLTNEKSQIFMKLSETPLRLYPHTQADFDTILEELGYTRMFIDLPALTPEFLSTYPLPGDTSESEHLVMVYKKGNTPSKTLQR
ncbi:MAG: class I SAM-dependent methyltransferase [Bdellovibrionales bacterium]